MAFRVTLEIDDCVKGTVAVSLDDVPELKRAFASDLELSCTDSDWFAVGERMRHVLAACSEMTPVQAAEALLAAGARAAYTAGIAAEQTMCLIKGHQLMQRARVEVAVRARALLVAAHGDN